MRADGQVVVYRRYRLDRCCEFRGAVRFSLAVDLSSEIHHAMVSTDADVMAFDPLVFGKRRLDLRGDGRIVHVLPVRVRLGVGGVSAHRTDQRSQEKHCPNESDLHESSGIRVPAEHARR